MVRRPLDGGGGGGGGRFLTCTVSEVWPSSSASVTSKSAYPDADSNRRKSAMSSGSCALWRCSQATASWGWGVVGVSSACVSLYL